jgi:O-antigen/teichoic acid export membrane protein
LPAESVGYYQAAFQIVVVFAVILSGFSKIIVPIISSLQKEKTLEDIEEIYRIGTKWAIYLSIPVLIILFFAPQDVLILLYGSEYRGAKNILLVLLIGQIINLITGPVAPLLIALGYQNYMLFFSGLALVINVALGVFLIPRIGLLGMAVSSSIATAFVYLSSLFVSLKRVKITPYDTRLLKGGIATIVTVGMVFLGQSFLKTLSFFDLMILFSISVVSFFSTLYFLGFDEEDKILFYTIQKKGKMGNDTI